MSQSYGYLPSSSSSSSSSSSQVAIRLRTAMFNSIFTKIFLLNLIVSLLMCQHGTVSAAAMADNIFAEEEAATPTFLLQPTSSNPKFRNDLEIATAAADINWERFNKLYGERLLHLLGASLIETQKAKRDDDIPPGFIGVRGRRSRQREFEDILRNFLFERQPILFASPNQQQQHNNQEQRKKSESNVYKDGFLGVRG